MAKEEKNATDNNTAGQNQSQTERVIANFRVGDRVRVYFKIEEGKQTREAFFEGQVIARKGSGPGKTFTVRKIAATIRPRSMVAQCLVTFVFSLPSVMILQAP